MKKLFTLSLLSILFIGCSAPGSRYGHSREPINLGGGKFLVEGYKLASGLERATEYCGTKEMITVDILRPIKEYEWIKITFICR